MIFETAVLHVLLAGPVIDLKCPSTMPFPGVEGPNPVMVVEGRVVVGDIEYLSDALNAHDVHSLAYTCWNPATDELPARAGVAVVVVTTGRAVEEAESDLRFLINAVRQFQALESRLPESLAEIGITGLAASRFELTISDQGAALSTAGPRDYHCSVSGDITDDVEMRCESSPSLAKVTLREAYDRGAQALQLAFAACEWNSLTKEAHDDHRIHARPGPFDAGRSESQVSPHPSPSGFP